MLIILYNFIYIEGKVCKRISYVLSEEVHISCQHLGFSLQQKESRCTVDMLNQKFYFKTKDVGKTSAVFTRPHS